MSNDPLNFISDSQDRSQYIETIQVYPRFINDGESGGSMSLVLPKKKAYLSASSRLILPCTVPNEGFQFAPSAGIFSLIESATMRTETGGIIDQYFNANKLYAMLNNLNPPERRANRDSVLYGVSNTFEGGSGSKMNADINSAEVLAGQMRMKGDFYETQYPANVVGRNGCKPNCISAGNNLILKNNFADTPEFSVSLGDLFPGLFKTNFQFPLALLMEEVIIDINFSKNAEFGSNDRAVCCPTLMQAENASSPVEASSAVAVGARFMGKAPAGDAGKFDQVFAQDSVIDSEGNAAAGLGFRVMVDLDGDAVPYNLRILDCGVGYNSGDTIIIDNGWQTPMQLQIGMKFGDWDEVTNFLVTEGGAGFVQDTEYTVVNPVNKDLNFKIKATGVDTGALTQVTLASQFVNDSLVLPEGTPVPLVVYNSAGADSGARLVMAGQIYTITNANASDTFAVGDGLFLQGDADEEPLAYVSTVDGTNYPTELYVVKPNSFEVDDVLVKVGSDPAVTFEVASFVGQPIEGTTTTGLGYDPVWSFDTVSGGKINIETGKVSLATDLIFYLDGKMERDLEKMMKEGFPLLYTQYVDVVSTLPETDGITSYGDSKVLKHSRQIGFSNEVLRNVMFSVAPIGSQPKNKFPYYNQSIDGLNQSNWKQNPLLNQYCSMASLVTDGDEFQINVNSEPYYSQPVQSDLRMMTELAKCHGSFYLPKATYCGWDACRQLDNPDTVDAANPSKQPGFTTLDDWDTVQGAFDASRQYEINERKMGIANQLWNGIPQKWALGQSHYCGCSFKFMDDANVPMNGVVVGNNAVDIRYNHTSTFNPWYGGTALMTLFGEVERNLLIKDGIIHVTTAAF